MKRAQYLIKKIQAYVQTYACNNYIRVERRKAKSSPLHTPLLENSIFSHKEEKKNNQKSELRYCALG